MPVYRTPAHDIDVISHSLEQTRRIGQRLAALLAPGDLILLEGPFGAGKTTFTQGIARGLGVQDDYITSPTFTLINEYAGRLPLYHVDLYRLETAAQAQDLGLRDYIEGEGVTVIEWPERAAGLLSAEHLAIYLSDIAETKRALRFHASGPRYAELLEQFKNQAFAPGAVPEHEPAARPAPGAPPR